MAASRLNDTQKQELVARYRSGEPSSALADAFECSVNTVSRTVRNLLPADEYDALKSARAKGLVVSESDPRSRIRPLLRRPLLSLKRVRLQARW